ncbi:DUF2156 domain-containing protein [Pseudonocardia sp. KRD-169]|uniref:DUF2156 domain-containing protein n=2 Tax=Pseudonocardia abyssalis TaxID=2792008 RepID=A0ABS6ULQ3_9PSEU|nr:DUF2156 domain-containing protein [Pseudonocardia abyssalis]MBW0133170.1 DUF2156 domain-containing protein [Pseudonocardia abyssalis]
MPTTEPPLVRAPRPGRLRRRFTGVPARRLLRILRQAPVTLGLVAVVWLVGALTGSLLGGPATGLRDLVGAGVPSLGAGRWWTPLSSGFWCSGLVGYLATTLLLLLLVAPLEHRVGSARTAALLAVTQVAGALAGTGLVALGTLAADPWADRLATDLALGPSTAAVGAALAASARLGALWRRRLRILLLVVLVMLALYSGSLQDVLRLAGGLVGLAAGPLLLGRPRGRLALTATGPEIRTLVALVVAASAVGPLLAALSGTAIGPLSVLRFLVLPPPPDPATVEAICADPLTVDDCLGLQFRLRLGGVGPAVMSVLPVLVLVVLADGLRRGRRFAWWGAVGINILFALLGVTLAVLTASTPTERLVAFGGATDAQFYTGVATTVLQPLAVVALLAATRARFRVTAPARAYRGWSRAVTVTLVAVSVSYVVIGYLLRDQFSPVPGFADLVVDLPTRFLPSGYLGELEIAFLPVGVAATVLYEWTGVVFWSVALAGSLWLVTRTRIVSGDAQAARDLLTSGGGSTLSWLVTWTGNSYWFTADRRAGFGYRVIGRVALTTGGPFGDAERRLDAIEPFTAFCAEHAWTPCLYSVDDDVRARAQSLGWQAVQVAEETVVPLPGLAFTGKKWQDVRSALNKATKAGITAEQLIFGQAPLAIVDQVRAISEEWVGDKGLPEMGFTLGGIDELADDAVRCLVAVDADRTVHGITSWLPVHDAGVVVGWTLDFMRRRETGFRGVMEFLIASAAQQFQAEGYAFLSLSGAPLARLDRGEQPDALQRLLDTSGRALEPVYGFRSLLAFKAKFQPEYRPLHMLYPDAAALPAVGSAIARAYLPDLGPATTLRLLRRITEARAPGRDTSQSRA